MESLETASDQVNDFPTDWIRLGGGGGSGKGRGVVKGKEGARVLVIAFFLSFRQSLFPQGQVLLERSAHRVFDGERFSSPGLSIQAISIVHGAQWMAHGWKSGGICSALGCLEPEQDLGLSGQTSWPFRNEVLSFFRSRLQLFLHCTFNDLSFSHYWVQLEEVVGI